MDGREILRGFDLMPDSRMYHHTATLAQNMFLLAQHQGTFPFDHHQSGFHGCHMFGQELSGFGLHLFCNKVFSFIQGFYLGWGDFYHNELFLSFVLNAPFTATEGPRKIYGSAVVPFVETYGTENARKSFENRISGRYRKLRIIAMGGKLSIKNKDSLNFR